MMLVFLTAALGQVAAMPTIRTAPVIVTPAPPSNARMLGALSPGGKRLLQAERNAQLARVRADVPRMRAAHRAVQRASLRRPLDLAAIRSAMEARDRLQYEIRQSYTRSAIAFLERLSPSDRALVAGSVAGTTAPVRRAPRN